MNPISEKQSSLVWTVIGNGMAMGHWDRLKIMHRNSKYCIRSIN